MNGSLEINNLGVLKDNRCKIRFLIINDNNNNKKFLNQDKTFFDKN